MFTSFFLVMSTGL